MDTQPAWFRQWVDQPPERNGARKGEIVSFGPMGLPHVIRRETLDTAHDIRREQSCSVDEHPRAQFDRLRAIRTNEKPVRVSHGTLERGVEGDARAVIFGLAQEREHEGVAAEDSGHGRVKRYTGSDIRFQAGHLRTAHLREIV